MLQPKRVKYRKMHRGRRLGSAHSGNTVAFGDFGLCANGNAWVTARQSEATRRVFVRFLRNQGKLWIRVFPDKPITKRAAESRMGKGKGTVEFWAAVVKPGRIMFEVGGLDEETSLHALKQASYKFSIRTKVIIKQEIMGGKHESV